MLEAVFLRPKARFVCPSAMDLDVISYVYSPQRGQLEVSKVLLDDFGSPVLISSGS